LATDIIGTNAVIKHAIKWFFDNNENVNFGCGIYATAPFVKSEYLHKGFELLINTDKMVSFFATTFPFSIQRAFRILENDGVEIFCPNNLSTRSQDIEDAYHDAGQFYWDRTEPFLNDVRLFSNDSIPIISPRHLVQDIDTLEEWNGAELIYQDLNMREFDN
jgi:pseudaminic acid cytidylyltransferase